MRAGVRPDCPAGGQAAARGAAIARPGLEGQADRGGGGRCGGGVRRHHHRDVHGKAWGRNTSTLCLLLSLLVRWFIRSVPAGGHIELFSIPASAPQLL